MALLSYEKVRDWLVGVTPYLLAPDDEDTAFLIADEFSASELKSLYFTANAIPRRRDEIIFAIGFRLECLLDPNKPQPENLSPEEQSSEIQELTLFVRNHWAEFVSDRIGFGVEFDRLVVPYIERTRKLHRPDNFDSRG